MIYYIPGCDFRRRHREASDAAIRYMNTKGIPLGACCRKDIDYLKPGDTLVINCTQCRLIFSERVPDVNIVSLYEYVLSDPSFPWPDRHGERLALQDCFRERNDPVLHDAVRRCLANMNVRITELPENRSDVSFCGVWLNNPPAEDCVQCAPQTFARLEQYRHLLSAEEQKAKMEAYVTSLPEEKTAVYCNGCEKGILLGGGHPVHMVQLLFENK